MFFIIKLCASSSALSILSKSQTRSFNSSSLYTNIHASKYDTILFEDSLSLVSKAESKNLFKVSSDILAIGLILAVLESLDSLLAEKTNSQFLFPSVISTDFFPILLYVVHVGIHIFLIL
ncbi:MAG: hypothetical protein WCG25_07670 [bacterium]